MEARGVNLFHEDNEDKPRSKYMIIPSLIDQSDDDGKSAQELYNEYKDQYEYAISYEFGKESCFVSAGLMDLFLVQLYSNINWDLHFLNSAYSFKKPIEARNPGKVFSVDFNSEGERKVSIVEEEICRDTNGSNISFYNSRKITIFTRASDDWTTLMKTAMQIAYKKLKSTGAPPQPKVSYKKVYFTVCYFFKLMLSLSFNLKI